TVDRRPRWRSDWRGWQKRAWSSRHSRVAELGAGSFIKSNGSLPDKGEMVGWDCALFPFGSDLSIRELSMSHVVSRFFGNMALACMSISTFFGIARSAEPA